MARERKWSFGHLSLQGFPQKVAKCTVFLQFYGGLLFPSHPMMMTGMPNVLGKNISSSQVWHVLYLIDGSSHSNLYLCCFCFRCVSDIIAADDGESNVDDAAASRNYYGFHPFFRNTASWKFIHDIGGIAKSFLYSKAYFSKLPDFCWSKERSEPLVSISWSRW